MGGTSSSHRSPSLLQHGALHSPVLYSAPPLQRVKCDPTLPATRDTRDNMGKAGDWTLALALSLTDPGHVSLLGLSPGQSNGESGDLSSLAAAEALVPFGPGTGCLRCVGPHISVTGPGEQEGQNCSLGKCCHRALSQPRQPGALRDPGRKQASSWLRCSAPVLVLGEEVAQPLGGAQEGKMALEKMEKESSLVAQGHSWRGRPLFVCAFSWG